MMMRRTRLRGVAGAPVTRTGLRRLFGFVRPYRSRLALAGLFTALGSLVFLALPWGMRYLIDAVVLRADLRLLNTVAVGLVVVLLVQSVFSYFSTYLVSYVGERVVADVRTQLFERLARLPLGYYNERKTGELMSRVANDATLIQTSVTNNVLNLLGQSVALIGGVAAMLATDWRLSLVIVGVLPPIAVFAHHYGGKLRRISRRAQDELGEANAVLEEALSGVRVVKAFGREEFESARFGASIERTFAISLERVRARAVFVPVVTMLGFTAVVVVMWYGGSQIIRGALTIGELTSMLMYMLLIIAPIGSLATLYGQLSEAVGAGERIFEVLDAEPEPLRPRGAPALPRLRGHVEYRGVGFSYVEGRDVLTDVNLHVEPGEVVALVGPSGAGKTTLVNLLPRFYEPQRGVILLDGRPTHNVTLDSLRSQISLVPQETLLFGATVAENIRYGRLDAGRDEIEHAARTANAHEFISLLPEGYDTLVGERGVKLSAGQRQRVAIARALLKDARLLILDEATSALDNESEALVQDALDRLMRDRTTLVIAHRLSTVEGADRIVVLDGGRIIEQGAHRKLLDLEGLYYRLYTRSFFSEPRRPEPVTTG